MPTPPPATTDWVPIWMQQASVDLSVYQLRSEKNAASGYVGLDASSRIVLGGDTYFYRTAPGQFVIEAGGGVTAQTDAALSVRKSGGKGNQLEFGHFNSGGYGSVLGTQSGSGTPFLAFFSEAGTTPNSFRTRGQPAVLLYPVTSTLVVGTVASANADNQTSIFAAIQASAFNVNSDRETKLDIREISDARPGWSEILMGAKPYRFKRYDEDEEHVGLMADELPPEVTTETEGLGRAVDVYKLCTALLGMLQLQNERISALEAKGATG